MATIASILLFQRTVLGNGMNKNEAMHLEKKNVAPDASPQVIKFLIFQNVFILHKLLECKFVFS